jgi:hypothetical protein
MKTVDGLGAPVLGRDQDIKEVFQACVLVSEIVASTIARISARSSGLKLRSTKTAPSAVARSAVVGGLVVATGQCHRAAIRWPCAPTSQDAEMMDR